MSIVNAVVDRTSPIYADGRYNGLASLDTYRSIIQKDWKTGPFPSEQTLKGMYESAKKDVRETADFRARKTIITNSLMLLISVFLFLAHWVWLRKLSGCD